MKSIFFSIVKLFIVNLIIFIILIIIFKLYDQVLIFFNLFLKNIYSFSSMVIIIFFQFTNDNNK
jgi:hypothetical protein